MCCKSNIIVYVMFLVFNAVFIYFASGYVYFCCARVHIRVVPRVMQKFQVSQMSSSNPPFGDVPYSDHTDKIS